MREISCRPRKASDSERRVEDRDWTPDRSALADLVRSKAPEVIRVVEMLKIMFVVDKPKLQRMIALTRDDRGGESVGGPFMRIEASGEILTLAGQQVEVRFGATVYQEGVLFLRVTLFRRMLAAVNAAVLGGRFVTIQVAEDGLRFAGTRLGFEHGDMLLYPDPSLAPARHPDDDPWNPTPDAQGRLFE